MKLAAFNCREDELAYFERFAKVYGVELVMTGRSPDLETIELVKGCQGISIITTPMSGEVLNRLHEYGVKVISTRTIGFEHLDCERATRLGMTVSNVSYSPHAVSEYTVMCMLMILRNMKSIVKRYDNQDYGLSGLRGRELHSLTVGVVGTGKIGETVIENLSGFGCRILAYDLLEKEHVKVLASYVSLEKLWEECDVITFHAPATEASYHMVNRESIARMKEGVVLVNTARGTLIDTDALIDGLTAGKIGAAALDVFEHERGIYKKASKHRETGNQEVGSRQLAILHSMPNVLMTPHVAFFTDQAVSNMVEYSIKSCVDTIEGKENPWQIIR